jgi:hypothetical protein
MTALTANVGEAAVPRKKRQWQGGCATVGRIDLLVRQEGGLRVLRAVNIPIDLV